MPNKNFGFILAVILLSIIDLFIVRRYINLRRIPNNGQSVNAEILKFKAAGNARYFTVRYEYEDKVYIKLLQVSHTVYNKYKDRRIMKVQFHVDNPNLVTWEGDRLPYVLILNFFIVAFFIGLLIILGHRRA